MSLLLGRKVRLELVLLDWMCGIDSSCHRDETETEEPRLELEDCGVTSAREVRVASGASGAAQGRPDRERHYEPTHDRESKFQPRRPFSIARLRRFRFSPSIASTLLPSVP